MKASFKYVLITTMSLCFIVSGLSAQHHGRTATKRAKAKPLEDQVKQFWFVLLTEGNNRTQDSITAAKIQQGHMANINRLYYEGKLKVAGPFGDDGNWKGIFIFDVATKEEVEKILQTDPAIASGRLAYVIHPWWTATVGSFKPGSPKKLPEHS